VIVVSAPSGAGKSTVLRRVLKESPGLRFSVSHTTRSPRPGERNGVEYHYVDRAEFERLRAAGRLLEWAEVHGNLYGTGLAELERAQADGVDLLLDVDVQGATQVRRQIADAVTVFILPPSYEVLEARLRGRGQDDEGAIRKRLEAAGRELHAYAAYDYAIINEHLDTSVEELKSIVTAARCRVSRRGNRAGEIERTFQSSKVDEKEEETA
jgi:guanylate kinase